MQFLEAVKVEFILIGLNANIIFVDLVRLSTRVLDKKGGRVFYVLS
jgi:hypothetical protein